MHRILPLILLLCLGPFGCSKTHTYTAYEVVRTPRALRPDDRVEIVLKGGSVIRGHMAGVEDEKLILFDDDGTRLSIPWEDVRAVQRMRRVQTKGY